MCEVISVLKQKASSGTLLTKGGEDLQRGGSAIVRGYFCNETDSELVYIAGRSSNKGRARHSARLFLKRNRMEAEIEVLVHVIQ